MKYEIDLSADIQHCLAARANETDQDVVHLIQLAVTRFVAEEVGANGDDSQWAPAKDDRRCELIDREIAGTISVLERAELAGLQRMAEQHFDRVASPDLARVTAVYQSLLDRLGKWLDQSRFGRANELLFAGVTEFRLLYWSS